MFKISEIFQGGFGSTNKVTMTGNVVGGDMVGGDMISGNKVSVSQVSSGRVSVNGKTYDLPAKTNSLEIKNNKVYVNGKLFEPLKNVEVPVVNFTLDAVGVFDGFANSISVGKIETAKSIETGNGDVTIESINTMQGDITVSNGDVSVRGDVTGNVETMSGDIDITGNVTGDVETMSGNIKYRK